MSKPMDDVQEIRRLLDERGVDYDEYSRNSSHVFEIDYCDACGDYLSEIEIFGACIYATKKYLTPEQAIATTLGGGYVSQDRFDELAEAYDKMADQSARLAEELNAMLGGGKLTAEQVSKATYAHSIHADCADADWQAIADELNAALGGGECKVVASSTDGLTTDEPKQWFRLSCGHAFKLDGLDAPVACPVCGKAVKR